MTSQDKPTILIVHGAWHQPLHYRPLINRLRQAKYTVLVPTLTTSGYDDSIDGKSHLDDVRRINETLLPVLDEGKRVIVIGHSYGGIPATEVIESQSVEERAARGLKGGIQSIIYISPVPALVKGLTPFDAGGKKWLSDVLFSVEEWRLPLNLQVAEDFFYHDVQDEERKRLAVDALAEHSHEAYRVPLTFSMQEVTVPKVFVACKKDKVISLELQHTFADAMKATKIYELDTGHSPFLTEEGLEELIRVIDETAARN